MRPALDDASAERKQSSEPVEQAVSSIQSFVQSIRRDLNFSLDDSSGRVVVKVTDTTSGEVIRQLPSEEALRLAESLEEVRSLLFKAEA
nr:flagellar protein FlaG [Pseudomonas fulva]